MASSAFSPFKHRDYLLYWVGNFISNIGTWMETVALGAYVADVTGKAFWSGIIAAAGFVPSGLLSPLGGVIADRFPRKPLLIGSTLFQTVAAGVLCWLAFADQLHPEIIAILVGLSGVASALAFPAYQSIVRDLVPPEEITAAIGLGSAQWNLGRVLGPALAGVVISLGSIGWALAINTLSFFAVVVTLLFITIPAVVKGAAEANLFQAMKRGFTLVRREPGLWVSTRAMLLNTLLAAPFIALVPAMAHKALNGDEKTVALLTTSQGIGAVLGALTVAALTKRFGGRKLLVGLMAAMPIGLILYGAGAAINTAAAAVGLALMGALYMMALITFSSAAQTRAPDTLRGRAVSVNTTILGIVYPIGALLQGALGDRIGVDRATIAAGIAFGLIIGAVHLFRPTFTLPLDTPATAFDG